MLILVAEKNSKNVDLGSRRDALGDAASIRPEDSVSVRSVRSAKPMVDMERAYRKYIRLKSGRRADGVVQQKGFAVILPAKRRMNRRVARPSVYEAFYVEFRSFSIFTM
jgi:hypothetical protein